MENICFGKEIKSLNILKNRDYKYDVFEADILGVSTEDLAKVHMLVSKIIDEYGTYMSSNIRYLTEKLVDARENSENKLISIMPARQNGKPCYGVFIYKQGGALFTCFYYSDYSACEFDKEGNSINNVSPKVAYIQFIDDKLSLIIATEQSEEGLDFFDAITPLAPKEITEGRCIPLDGMDICLEFDFLLDHVEIETKHLQPKSKIKGFGTSYLNLTTNNIKVIDSRWFTNLIKSDAFKVRGHFRFQPCGLNLSSKKLIWINDFQKTGYTSKAQKTKAA
jgi:hypothetical protein